MPVPTRSRSPSKTTLLLQRLQPAVLTAMSGTHHSDVVSLISLDDKFRSIHSQTPSDILTHSSTIWLQDEASRCSEPAHETQYRTYRPVAGAERPVRCSQENAAHLMALLAILGSRSTQSNNNSWPETCRSPPRRNLNREFASSYLRTSSISDNQEASEACRSRTKDYSNKPVSPSASDCLTYAHKPPTLLIDHPTANTASSGDLATAFTTDPDVFAPLCEPFSFWIADYIWRVVTTGMSLAPDCHGPMLTTPDPQSFLPLLAESISSLLLSTLLQPSAIFLSLYYISRLPAYIGPCALDADPQSTKSLFRKALASADATSHECPVTRTLYASFKLFVLGAVLSNKVLDDHVFTLKTWHEISGLPLKALNKLEWLALDILDHELYVQPVAWRYWLNALESYHLFSTSPGNIPESASRLVRVVLEGLVVAQDELQYTRSTNPIFLGIRDRIKVKDRQKLQAVHLNLGDFDMDEDGPLREEYMPKRNISSREMRLESKWTSPTRDDTRYTREGPSVWPDRMWLGPLDVPSQSTRLAPSSGGESALPSEPRNWSLPYPNHEPVEGEHFDPTTATTLRDYFLTCSRIQGNLNSRWISHLA